MRYVIVSGGVLSGLGKGVTASSIGMLLKSLGYRVTAIKIDPYLNSDAGTMSPFEHGEVFVLDDGGEVDLDLGNYERFLDITLTRDNNLTTGKVYANVIEGERRGDYLGKTVQVVPHITNEIQDWMDRVASIPVDGNGDEPDVCIVELGGTVGDIESAPFVEALRQFQFRVGKENFVLVHVSLVPVVGVVGEQKTKPTQHTVKELRAAGLSPDFLVCRSEEPLEQATKDKLALFCHVPPSHILSAHDVSNLYRVPLLLEEQNTTAMVAEKLGLKMTDNRPQLDAWREMADHVDSLENEVTIAMVGKYTGLTDSYLSVIKALQHSAFKVGAKMNISWVDATGLEPESESKDPELYANSWQDLKAADGVLVPGGFGNRGIEGMILAAQYARENHVPYLGVCLGLQVAVIEFTRNVLGKAGANSTEFDEDTPHPAVIFMPEGSRTHMGGTMRLGSRQTNIQTEDCAAVRLYDGATEIHERHRHRYEVNPDMISDLEAAGLNFVGKDTEAQRMEIIELAGHKFFFGTQYHPEFKSRPNRPSPPFFGLVEAAFDSQTH
uniref:CTP synthase n=1 Tax=uncultured marine group II/III euryarchaeote KM3_66_F08 TaxID=1456482 RepID=A0A075HCM4_9EURY|nr:CTP synthase (pyrG) [uncultured marine group II/III euryarchaeote KM3_66_F08]